MAVITANATGGNWTAGTSWVGGIAPTAADDAVVNATSGNVTWNTGSVFRSANFTGYLGTLTHNAGVTVNAGDATAGAGSIALDFGAGMTYTKGSTSTCELRFISTSATQQTIDFAGHIMGDVTFDGVGGSWILASDLSLTDDLTFNAGSLDTGGFDITASGLGDPDFNVLGSGVKVLTLNDSIVTMRLMNWSGTNFTLNAGTSLLRTDDLTATGKAFYDVADYSGNIASLILRGGAGNTFNSITVTSANSNSFLYASNFTVGTLTLTGATADRMLMASSTVGSPVTITATTVVASQLDIRDTTGAGAFGWDLSAITGGSGDAGGNTGIIFTTGAAQYAVGLVGTTTNWGATATWASSSGGVAGTGRIPLAQDTTVVDANSGTGTRLNLNVARLSGDILWNKATVEANFNYSGADTTLYGGFEATSILDIIGVTPAVLGARGGSHNIDFGTATGVNNWTFDSIGGSYSVTGTMYTSGVVTVTSGALTTGGNPVSFGRLIATNALANVNINNTTLTLLGTTAATILNIGPLITWSATGSTIVVGLASASTRTIAGGGKTFGVLDYSVAASTGQLTITASNTWSSWVIQPASGARTILVGSSTAQTFTGTPLLNGTAGNLVSIIGVAGGGAETMSKASGIVSADYLNVVNSTAAGGATWYAGANSIDGGGNVGWIFTAPSIGMLGMVI